MLENHGVVIGGRDLKDAFQRFETLEFVAQTLVKAATLGDIRPLPAERLVERGLPDLAGWRRPGRRTAKRSCGPSSAGLSTAHTSSG